MVYVATGSTAGAEGCWTTVTPKSEVSCDGVFEVSVLAAAVRLFTFALYVLDDASGVWATVASTSMLTDPEWTRTTRSHAGDTQLSVVCKVVYKFWKAVELGA